MWTLRRVTRKYDKKLIFAHSKKKKKLKWGWMKNNNRPKCRPKLNCTHKKWIFFFNLLYKYQIIWTFKLEKHIFFFQCDICTCFYIEISAEFITKYTARPNQQIKWFEMKFVWLQILAKFDWDEREEFNDIDRKK